METTQWYIFDLDGTLYDFWWTWFSNSRLWLAVKESYLTIMQKNNYQNPKEKYKDMCDIEESTWFGISLQLAKELRMSRGDILRDTWWSINPEDIIISYEYPKIVLSELRKEGKPLFLVTAAPRVWAHKALNYMNISGYLESFFWLEDFVSSKKEVFHKININIGINTKYMISVWDQIHTDIIPAQELWMQTLLVQKQDDILKLLTL